LVRIVWACLAIFAGTGFLAYIICWLVIPNEE
jgi:phage shock protein PspC (stress-responsive transcriptional regulator)